MGSLDLTVQLRSSALDVSVTDALILDMPVELGLELMPIAHWEAALGTAVLP
jgi:hypothetical protein